MKKIISICVAALLLLGTVSANDLFFTVERTTVPRYCQAAYNGTTCVAVGGRGLIKTTQDFENWTFCDIDTWLDITDVAWTGEKFIAAATNQEPGLNFSNSRSKLLVSENGYQWDVLTELNQYIHFTGKNSDGDIYIQVKPEGGYILENSSTLIPLDEATNQDIVSEDIRGMKYIRKYTFGFTDPALQGQTIDLPAEIPGVNPEPQVEWIDLTERFIDQGYLSVMEGKQYLCGRKVGTYTLAPMLYNPEEYAFFATAQDVSSPEYCQAGDHYMLRDARVVRDGGMFEKNYETYRKRCNKVYFYDKDFNLVHTAEFDGVVMEIWYRDGVYFCHVRQLGSGYTAYSYDMVNWNTYTPEARQQVKGYKTAVSEWDGQEQEDYTKQLCSFKNFAQNGGNALRLSYDGIYYVPVYSSANELEIPYTNFEYIWEEENNLVLQRGSLRYRIPKEPLYEKLHQVQEAPYVVVNDKLLAFSQPPVIEEGRTLVPMRFLFEQMDMPVDWDQETQTATAVKNGQRVAFSIDNNTALVNDEPKAMDVPAQLVEGKTMIPIRFLSEELGYAVNWDEGKNMVTIEASPSIAMQWDSIGKGVSNVL